MLVTEYIVGSCLLISQSLSIKDADKYIYISDHIGIKFDNLTINFNAKITHYWTNWTIELVTSWAISAHEATKKSDISAKWVHVWISFILNPPFVLFVIDPRWFVEAKKYEV